MESSSILLLSSLFSALRSSSCVFDTSICSLSRARMVVMSDGLDDPAIVSKSESK